VAREIAASKWENTDEMNCASAYMFGGKSDADTTVLLPPPENKCGFGNDL
jgi:hypothetical protein